MQQIKAIQEAKTLRDAQGLVGAAVQVLALYGGQIEEDLTVIKAALPAGAAGDAVRRIQDMARLLQAREKLQAKSRAEKEMAYATTDEG